MHCHHGQELHQFGVNEQLFLARLHFAQNANGGHLFQVAQGRLTLGNVFFDQITNAAIGLLKDHVHQLTGVDLGQALTRMGGGVLGQRANGGNLAGGPLGGFRSCVRNRLLLSWWLASACQGLLTRATGLAQPACLLQSPARAGLASAGQGTAVVSATQAPAACFRE